MEGTWQRFDIFGQIGIFMRFRIRGPIAASLCPVWAQITYLSWFKVLFRGKVHIYLKTPWLVTYSGPPPCCGSDVAIVLGGSRFWWNRLATGHKFPL